MGPIAAALVGAVLAVALLAALLRVRRDPVDRELRALIRKEGRTR